LSQKGETLVELGGKTIPFLIDYRDLVRNPKCTSSYSVVVEGVKATEFNGRKYLWPLRVNRGDTAYEGSLVWFGFATGSHKHIYRAHSMLFRVAEIGEREYDGLKVRNLELITDSPPLTWQGLPSDELRAEMTNEGYAVARDLYKAQSNVVAYLALRYLKPEPPARRVEFYIRTVEDVDKAIEELKKLRAQLEEPRIRGVIASTPPS